MSFGLLTRDSMYFLLGNDVHPSFYPPKNQTTRGSAIYLVDSTPTCNSIVQKSDTRVRHGRVNGGLTKKILPRRLGECEARWQVSDFCHGLRCCWPYGCRLLLPAPETATILSCLRMIELQFNPLLFGCAKMCMTRTKRRAKMSHIWLHQLSLTFGERLQHHLLIKRNRQHIDLPSLPTRL